jgi:hypothetical protein
MSVHLGSVPWDEAGQWHHQLGYQHRSGVGPLEYGRAQLFTMDTTEADPRERRNGVDTVTFAHDQG